MTGQDKLSSIVSRRTEHLVRTTKVIDAPMSCSSRLRSLYESFLYERSGAIAVVATLLFTVLLLASGGAIDYGIITQKQSQLQSAADAAALAGAKRLSFAGGNLADATEITNAVVKITLR